MSKMFQNSPSANGSGAIYVSAPTVRSLGNDYRIYYDRLELKCRIFFTTIIIERDNLVSIDLFPPPVIKTAFWALKLDFADLYEHVGITRKSGRVKNLRFTPRNPREFVDIADTLLSVLP